MTVSFREVIASADLELAPGFCQDGRAADGELAQSLVLSAPADGCLSVAAAELLQPGLKALQSGVARASREAVLLPEGFGDLSETRWSSLFAWCAAIVKPDGVVVLGFPGQSAPELESLRTALAGHFGAIDIFSWDGVRRASVSDSQADLFAVCRLFVPYPMRSLELLGPRVLAAQRQSSWLCERPALPESFLLRARVETIGDTASVDIRLKFMTSRRAWFVSQFSLDGPCNELLISSQNAEKRGKSRWQEVERISIEVAGRDERSTADVRISELRICHRGSSSHGSSGRSSAQLRGDYDEDYYKRMTGFEEYRDSGGLRGYVNVHRAYSLLPMVPACAVDIGCGRGELAKHLIEEGGEVTLLDYSPAALGYARELIGDSAQASFVVDDAANLGVHVPAQSQDAIFMTDFVEHLEVDELRTVLKECRRALSTNGSLVIHTPERYCGAIATAKAIHGLHVNLFEISTLQGLLEEIFEEVEVFTWDGVERFYDPGFCIELFALARPLQTRATRPLTFACEENAGSEKDNGVASWVLDRPELPQRFTLDATVDILPATVDGALEISFFDEEGSSVARVVRDISRLSTLPAHLRLASELLSERASVWGEVRKIQVSATDAEGAPLDLEVSQTLLHVDDEPSLGAGGGTEPSPAEPEPDLFDSRVALAERDRLLARIAELSSRLAGVEAHSVECLAEEPSQASVRARLKPSKLLAELNRPASEQALSFPIFAEKRASRRQSGQGDMGQPLVSLKAKAVAYLLPGLPPEGSGGSHSLVQEARGLRLLGCQARICVPELSLERAAALYGNTDDLFVAYQDPAELGDAVGPAEVAIATEHPSLPMLERLVEAHPEIAPAYYVQDYEPLFSQPNSGRSDRALLSYNAIPGQLLFAKTHWLCNVVSALHGSPIVKVTPSLDREVFHAEDRARPDGVVRIAAMVRPRTPRRRPRATIEILQRIGAELGDGVQVFTFGCDAEAYAQLGVGHPGPEHVGLLTREKVAELMRSCDIFIDASAYQAFGRTGLEAMACGVVPVLPTLGGVHEYAQQDRDSLIFEDDRPAAIAESVLALARDRDRLECLREAALRSAGRFSIELAAKSQLEIFSEVVSRGTQPGRAFA